MGIVNLDQKFKKVKVSEFSTENPIVFEYFDKLPAAERDDMLSKAIYIGVLALMEDRIAAFLAKTRNELGTELESLKIIFEAKMDEFYRTTIKGTLAEDEITDFLNTYFTDKKLNDKAFTTGNVAGEIPRNKTGDIICELDGNPDLKIVIECKFDKSIKLGDIASKDIFTKKMDTAWNQLLEARANRDSKVSMMVFDRSLCDASIIKQFENVGYIPGVGFVSIIDSQKGDYTNLVIAYLLARDIALNAHEPDLDHDLLAIIMKRIIKDLKDIMNIKCLVENNIENNMEILKQLEKSMLLMEFNSHYLSKFLKDGKLTNTDLLAFYMGEDVKDKFKPIEKEIKNLA
jgi:hypothetical protein